MTDNIQMLILQMLIFFGGSFQLGIFLIYLLDSRSQNHNLEWAVKGWLSNWLSVVGWVVIFLGVS